MGLVAGTNRDPGSVAVPRQVVSEAPVASTACEQSQAQFKLVGIQFGSEHWFDGPGDFFGVAALHTLHLYEPRYEPRRVASQTPLLDMPLPRRRRQRKRGQFLARCGRRAVSERPNGIETPPVHERYAFQWRRDDVVGVVPKHVARALVHHQDERLARHAHPGLHLFTG